MATELHHQHQNFAKHCIATIETNKNNVLTVSEMGAPNSTWLLCDTDICYEFNHIAHKSLDNRTPMEILKGLTNDISVLLQFSFLEPVYHRIVGATLPSDSIKKHGCFVGITDSVGDALTYKILTEDTNCILHRSSVRSASVPSETNLCLATQHRESISRPINIFKLCRTRNQNSYALKELPEFTPNNLIGCTFFTDSHYTGERLQAHITRKLIDPETNLLM